MKQGKAKSEQVDEDVRRLDRRPNTFVLGPSQTEESQGKDFFEWMKLALTETIVV